MRHEKVTLLISKIYMCTLEIHVSYGKLIQYLARITKPPGIAYLYIINSMLIIY